MKINVPKGWFARILLGAWVLLFAGTLITYVLGSLAPRSLPLDPVTPLWILSIFVALGTTAYIASFAIRRLYAYLSREWRKDASLPFTTSPVERVLLAGWCLFVVLALGTLPLSQQKWVQAFGPEILLSLFCLVTLCSMAYVSYMLLRQVMKYIRRG